MTEENNTQVNTSIYDVQVLGQKEDSPLSKFKKWVCRMLKITPLVLFRFDVKFKLTPPVKLVPNHIIMLGDGSKWLVSGIGGGYIHASGITPRMDAKINNQSLWVIGSTHVEIQEEEPRKRNRI